MRGDQLARQWQLIQRLARSRAGVGLEELASDLGCVRRTVYRDLDALMYAGFPVVSEKRDNHVYYRFLDSFKLGDVPFTPDEVLALALAQDLLGVLEGTVFHDSIQSALAKIRASLGTELAAYLERLAESFRVLPGPHKRYAEYRDTIQLLNDAVVAQHRVRMRYRTGRTGGITRRREAVPWALAGRGRSSAGSALAAFFEVVCPPGTSVSVTGARPPTRRRTAVDPRRRRKWSRSARALYPRVRAR